MYFVIKHGPKMRGNPKIPLTPIPLRRVYRYFGLRVLSTIGGSVKGNRENRGKQKINNF